jgi:hypothetical protein
MLELLFTGTKVIDLPALSWANMRFYWVRDWEAAHLRGTAANGARRIFRDGTEIQYTRGINEASIGSRAGGSLVKYQQVSVGVYNLFAFEPFTGLFHLTPFQTVGLFTLRCLLDEEAGLVLRATGSGTSSNVLRAYNLAGGILWNETFAWNFQSVQWAAPGRAALLAPAAGRVVLYDYLNREAVLESSIEPAGTACWDSNRGLVVAIMLDGTTRVWHPTPVPALLGQVSFTPDPAQHQGSRLTVQLTGDVGEPCPGWWVKWRLVGDKGELEKPHSRTDAAGVARNYYFGPELESGAEILICEVEV